MNEDRKRILGMLAEGKITADEADMLLDSLGAPETAAPVAPPSPSTGWPTGPSASGTPKFMYVKVTGNDNVDVKVPLALLRTGLKLTSLIPPQAMNQINESMGEAGMSFDLNNIKPEDIEDIIASLGEMEVNVQSAEGDHVRVFCA
ncbi:MAG: SHOCT-like domain-containing protein [Coriobacteriia bacterium]